MRKLALMLALCAVLMTTSSLVASASASRDREPGAEARRLVEESEVEGGLAVHLGCGDGRLTAALGRQGRFVVHGLEVDAAQVEAARAHIDSRGLYGRVSVQQWNGADLLYADNLVNLLVVEERGQLTREEMMRVLAPGGVLCSRDGAQWSFQQKPRPQNIGEWSHYLHDGSNNAVTRDEVVAPPYHMQWEGRPKYSRQHESLASVSAAVSAGGRIFYIVDRAPAASILLQPEWALVARDAFSGVVLWERDISSWANWRHRFRWGPIQLPRRLVASEDRVFATLKLNGPVKALDASSGKTLKTYAATAGTQEIIHAGHKLYLLIDPAAGKNNADSASHRLVAVNPDSGERLWQRTEEQPMALTLAASGGRVFYQNDTSIVCLDADSGKRLWKESRPVATDRPGWSAPTLVVQNGVVLSADRRADLSRPEGNMAWNAPWRSGAMGRLIAFSAKNGQKLWSTKCAEAFHAPVDVFVDDGLVWVGQDRMRHNADFTRAYDLRSGDVAKSIQTASAFQTTMGHHRCYRNKATSRFIIAGRTGVEFINTDTGETLAEHWIRGTCQYGIMPANGLLYVPPHACGCYIRAKLAGFFAMAPADTRRAAKTPQDADGERLERAPAFGSVDEDTGERETRREWPQYRHGPARSGVTSAKLPAELSGVWQVDLADNITSPVVADKKVFVASIDTHRVYALDEDTGETLWTFRAGGRVDSPPAFHAGYVVFGSADGRVYCLRASDGKPAWTFRAAPRSRRIMSRGQLESRWPVHGSVLVTDERTDGGTRAVAYCAAGKSSYLDSGIYLYRLALRTGKVLSRRRVYTRNPETGGQPEEPRPYELPGAKPDILSAQDDRIYMRHRAYDPETLEQRKAPAHLFSPAGFLDDTWWHRTYWIYGSHFYSGYIGWFFAGREGPAGRILVYDDENIYGYGYRPEFMRGRRGRKYHLFASPRSDQVPQGEPDYGAARGRYRGEGEYRTTFGWTQNVPLLVRGMVLANDTLFVAGPPDDPTDIGFAKKSWTGQKGGHLMAVSADGGETLWTTETTWMPRFDGMAATDDGLYVSTADGKVLKLAGQSE